MGWSSCVGYAECYSMGWSSCVGYAECCSLGWSSCVGYAECYSMGWSSCVGHATTQDDLHLADPLFDRLAVVMDNYNVHVLNDWR